MNQIREWLYIGKYRETKDVGLLKQYDISAMLLLAELVKHPEIESLYVQWRMASHCPLRCCGKGWIL